jgi:hypothetical protein
MTNNLLRLLSLRNWIYERSGPWFLKYRTSQFTDHKHAALVSRAKLKLSRDSSLGSRQSGWRSTTVPLLPPFKSLKLIQRARPVGVQKP